jgi:hypothetical protein
MTDFEKQVLSDLAELKTQMKLLLGNGQPGRMQQLEDRVARHETFVQRTGGLGAGLAMLLTMIQLLIAYMRLR